MDFPLSGSVLLDKSPNYSVPYSLRLSNGAGDPIPTGCYKPEHVLHVGRNACCVCSCLPSLSGVRAVICLHQGPDIQGTESCVPWQQGVSVLPPRLNTTAPALLGQSWQPPWCPEDSESQQVRMTCHSADTNRCQVPCLALCSHHPKFLHNSPCNLGTYLSPLHGEETEAWKIRITSRVSFLAATQEGGRVDLSPPGRCCRAGLGPTLPPTSTCAHSCPGAAAWWQTPPRGWDRGQQGSWLTSASLCPGLLRLGALAGQAS